MKIKKQLLTQTKKAITSFSLAVLMTATACGSTSSTTGTDSSDAISSTVFPANLAVSSPLDYTTDSSTSSSSSLIKAASSSHVSYYAWATGRIDLLLAGSTPALCTFNPAAFLTQASDAECYGPQVQYAGHPDALTAAEEIGQLPSGDVGIWQETDTTTGHACAAAQVNARMEGVRDKSFAALMGMASLICTVNANSLSMPDATTTTVDLTSYMPSISGVTFTNVALNFDNSTGSDRYSYDLDFDYDDGTEVHTIVVDMVHEAGSTAGAYKGRLSYLVDDTFSPSGNCSTTDVTQNGSLLYERVSSSEMKLEARTATVCGNGSDIRVDGILDETASFGNNFDIFTADYNPSNLAGDYVYSWQAGEGDDSTRVFNLNVDSSANSTAFYGFGDQISSTSFDGHIDGFICNWAGPNGSHTKVDYAQYQTMSYDSTTGLVNANTSNIGYAPTNSCSYDGLGSFTYDSDSDGTTDTDTATAISNDLLGLTDADANSIFDEIEASGFTLPTAPTNL